MTTFNKFLLILFILVFSLFVQETRILRVVGINPNLILVVSMLIIFSSGQPRESFWFFTFLFISLLGLSVLSFPFWLTPLIALGILSLVVIFLKRFMTGNDVADFLVSVIVATVAFYLLNNLFRLGTASWYFLPKEIFYNFVLGLVLWFLILKRIFSFEINE